MPISNEEVAAALDQDADDLEKEFSNPFRIRAYRKAARSIRKLSGPVTDLIKEKSDLTKIYGIGAAMAAHIKTIAGTGKPPVFVKQKARLQSELKHIKGLGPKRLRTVQNELKITTKDELKKAIAAGQPYYSGNWVYAAWD